MPHAVSPASDIPSFQGEKLFVNDGLLGPNQVGALRQSSADMPMEVLQRRYNEDGYVFVKGLLPRQDVLKAREEYFSMLAPSGVLKPGTQPVEGVFNTEKNPQDYPGIGAGATGGNGRPGEETASQFVDLALQAHYADWYKETFCKHPVLKNFIARMTGWGDEHTLAVRRSLLRNNTPGNKAIGVHYDQIFLRYGHTLGREVEADFTEKAKASGLTDEEAKYAFNQNMLSTGLLADGAKEYSETFGRRWLATSYEAGDVVLHNPFAIHASTMNYDPNNVIRVGTDLRFVDSSKPWDKRWDKDYTFNDGV
ncbi:hypothetical protein OPT61_g3251 [Boeremia exigua]|uniref:Uncharacterized protein n=1 Tax=Boeremia exigua TaxID=749465 RepID=A0ACC2IIJ8_9PLEO|nr:hypothetical protein OPT61_g3251 [Boeremia exigua]